MPGCWALTAAIPMQTFTGSVKLTCPENQCQIMRRLEIWKHKDLGNQGYTYSLESNQLWGGAVVVFEGFLLKDHSDHFREAPDFKYYLGSPRGDPRPPLTPYPPSPYRRVLVGPN